MKKHINPGQNICFFEISNGQIVYGSKNPITVAFTNLHLRTTQFCTLSHVFLGPYLPLVAQARSCCWQRKSFEHVYTKVSARRESTRGRQVKEILEKYLDGANGRGLGIRWAVDDKRSIAPVFLHSVFCCRWTWLQLLPCILSIDYWVIGTACFPLSFLPARQI